MRGDGPVPAAGVPVNVRYFAGARSAAGLAAETVAAADLSELLETLGARHGARLAKVLGSCSFLINGLVCHDRLAALPAGATVDVLPPFAGG